MMATLLGTTRADAQKNIDLFTWFSFEKVDEPASDGASGTSVYRPNGPAFRLLVKLELAVAPDETIQAAALIALRRFIDDPATCVQAADLVKSFVHYGDSPAAGDFAREIMARSINRSSRPVIMRGSGPSASGAPSAPYAVFTGESTQGSLGNLTLVNRRDGGEPVLVLSLKGAERRQGWWARLIHRAR